ncbi:hypothetical protein R6Q59_022083 [Mikania micrantha]
MGKYIGRNSKTTGEVSLIDIPSYTGVRTWAKTLALQKAAGSSTAAGSYIQLRSHRLVKPTAPKRQKENWVPQKSNKSFGIDDEGSFGENMLGEEEADVKEDGTRIPFSPFSPFRPIHTWFKMSQTNGLNMNGSDSDLLSGYQTAP